MHYQLIVEKYCRINPIFLKSNRKKTSDTQSEPQVKNRRKTIKTLSATRWSVRHDSCESLFLLWEPVYKSLEEIENEETQKPIVKCQAKGIRAQLERLETAFMICFWELLLSRINAVSKQLQAECIDIFSVINLYDGLVELIIQLRNEESFHDFENEALIMSRVKECEKSIKRQKKKKKTVRRVIYTRTFFQC